VPLIPFNYQAAAGGVPAAFAAWFDEPWIINGLTWMSVKQAEADRHLHRDRVVAAEDGDATPEWTVDHLPFREPADDRRRRHQLEALARRNGTTTSSIVAQIIAERLNTPEQQADHTLDDLDPVTERTAVSPNIARARPTA
jgi:hypothetical protein